MALGGILFAAVSMYMKGVPVTRKIRALSTSLIIVIGFLSVVGLANMGHC